MGKLFTLTGYSHWASYIINGDPSGLDESELSAVMAWLAGNDVEAIPCYDCSEESFFGTPDGPSDYLQGDVVDYTFCEN
ncbi:MAG: hypothetical protein EOO38_09765 [Cytophagaceae bacterium]|nr:MAG: hypothetical protein EOO38_09765 [Cytophagaceae bacterium]